MRIHVRDRHVQVISYILFLLLIPLLIGALWLLVQLVAPTVLPLQFAAVIEAVIILVLIYRLITVTLNPPPSADEEELRASHEQFLALYERSPVPYVIIDGEGHILMYNLAAVRLLRTTTKALIGQGLPDRFTHEDQNILSVVLGKINAGMPVTDAELQVRADDGDMRWVLVSVFVHADAAQRLVSMVDITHQKTIDRAKSEFVALATHQLRTPVAALRWNHELLARTLKGTATPQQQKYLDSIARNTMRMISLINDFLSVSKLETGTFATTLTSINLTEFFDAAVDEYAAQIAEKHIALDKKYEPRNITFTTDVRLLHIIVSNLLSNAIKYMPPGEAVRVGYTWSAKTLTIEIADTGIGIPADQTDKLFTKFFRARNAQVHQAEGTGLGLYIVKQSVEKLGGTIRVASEEGVGTRFVITLPYQS